MVLIVTEIENTELMKLTPPSRSFFNLLLQFTHQKNLPNGIQLHKIYGEEEGVNEFVFTRVLSAFALPKYIHVGKQVHCFALKMGLLSFLSMGKVVVTMYAKCGSLDCALRTFELSIEKNSITWSAMITGYAHCGDPENALKLFSSMDFSRMNPIEFTLVGVLNACSDSTVVEERMQIHGYSVKLGFESQIYIMTALVDMYAKFGLIGDARKGFDYLQKPDLVLWTFMIGGYVQNGENKVAMSLYCQMQTEGILPNDLTMVGVLRACASLAAGFGSTFCTRKNVFSLFINYEPYGNIYD